MKNIISKLNKIIEVVLNSKLDENIKNYLYKAFSKIKTNIEEFFICGAFPIMESIESVVCHDLMFENINSNIESVLMKNIIETE